MCIVLCDRIICIKFVGNPLITHRGMTESQWRCFLAQRPLWPPAEHHLPLLVVSVWLIISSVSVLETKTHVKYLLNCHGIYS